MSITIWNMLRNSTGKLFTTKVGNFSITRYTLELIINGVTHASLLQQLASVWAPLRRAGPLQQNNSTLPIQLTSYYKRWHFQQSTVSERENLLQTTDLYIAGNVYSFMIDHLKSVSSSTSAKHKSLITESIRRRKKKNRTVYLFINITQESNSALEL
jgi:hypothetical protein